MRNELRSTWEKVPTDYYQKGIRTNLLQKIWHHLKISSAKRVLRNYQFSNLLDIGCASGYMLSKLTSVNLSAEYYGVDVYKEAINFAKKHYPNIMFKVGSAEKLPFKNNSFDLITFYEVIEHVQNPLSSLKEIKRVLNRNGVCILAMDSGNLLFRLTWLVWENTKGKIWKGAHLHPFHHTELEELIKKADLKITKKFFTHLGMEVTFILSK